MSLHLLSKPAAASEAPRSDQAGALRPHARVGYASTERGWLDGQVDAGKTCVVMAPDVERSCVLVDTAPWRG